MDLEEHLRKPVTKYRYIKNFLTNIRVAIYAWWRNLEFARKVQVAVIWQIAVFYILYLIAQRTAANNFFIVREACGFDTRIIAKPAKIGDWNHDVWYVCDK